MMNVILHLQKNIIFHLKQSYVPEDPELRKQVENFEVCYTDMQNGILLEPAPFAGRKAGDSARRNY